MTEKDIKEEIRFLKSLLFDLEKDQMTAMERLKHLHELLQREART